MNLTINQADGLQDGLFSVNRSATLQVPVSQLRYSFPRLQEKFPSESFVFHGMSYEFLSLTSFLTFASERDKDLRSQMPNEWREKSGGRPVYCVQMRVWQDDVSGNVSKQCNKHFMFCMTHAGIPKKLLAQEYFTRYICCSPHASVLELASAVADSVRYATTSLLSRLVLSFTYRQSRKGIVAFDSSTDEEAMFFYDVIYDSSDNPMTSKCSSHLGLGSNFFCPRCKAGGSKTFKTSDAGYHSLFNVSY